MHAPRLVRALALPLLALPFLGWVQLTLGDANDLPLHWSTGYSIPYHVHSAGYSGLPLGRLRGAIDRAFTSWEMPCSTLHSAVNPNGRDGDTPAQDGHNVIRFEERALPPEVDPQTVLAFTMHVGVYCTGMITESDITFNGVTFGWSDGNGGDLADVETVALHEIGHLLGLGHTQFDWAVMYPSIVERLRRSLSRDETDAMCAIYDAGLGTECSRNRDCSGGEVCLVGPTSNESLSAHCEAPLGAGRAGQRCNPAADFCDTGCANGFCLQDGLCSALCRADADCPAGWLCFQETLESGQDYGYCVDLTLCDADVDACPAGQVCTVSEQPSGDALFRICVDPAGAGDVGDPCRSADTCRNGLCVDGQCTAPCDAAADCPAPFDCVPTEFSVSNGGTDTVSLCLVDTGPCSSNADCDPGLACVFRAGDNATTTECARSLGGGPAGTACRSARDCEAGVCLAGLCTAPCRADADCPDGWACDRAPILGNTAAACVPGESPLPTPDAGPATPADAAVGPSPGADTGTSPGETDANTSGAGGGLEPAVADGGLGTADVRVPGSMPISGADAAVGGGAVKQSSGGSTGCAVSAPGRVTGAWPLLLAVPGFLRLRRVRRRTA